MEDRTSARIERRTRSSDDRIACPRCGKSIVPRIITDRGRLVRTVCPFCGATVKRFYSWRLLLVMLLLVITMVAILLPVLARR